MTLNSIYSNDIIIIKLYTDSIHDISQRSVNGILVTNEIPPSPRDIGLYLYIQSKIHTHYISSYIYIYIYIYIHIYVY